MNELIQKYSEFLAESPKMFVKPNFETFMFWLTRQQDKVHINQCQHRYPTEYSHPTSTGTIDPNICMICGLRK